MEAPPPVPEVRSFDCKMICDFSDASSLSSILCFEMDPVDEDGTWLAVAALSPGPFFCFFSSLLDRSILRGPLAVPSC